MLFPTDATKADRSVIQEHPHARHNCVGVPPQWQFDSAQLHTQNAVNASRLTAKAKLLTTHPSILITRFTKAHIIVYPTMTLQPLRTLTAFLVS
jgi:hypothetical protein